MDTTVANPLTIHSTRIERATAALGAARVLTRDPDRLDQVLVLLQALNLGTLRRRLAEIDSNPDTQRLLRRHPAIAAGSTLEALREVREGAVAEPPGVYRRQRRPQTGRRRGR